MLLPLSFLYQYVISSQLMQSLCSVLYSVLCCSRNTSSSRRSSTRSPHHPPWISRALQLRYGRHEYVWWPFSLRATVARTCARWHDRLEGPDSFHDSSAGGRRNLVVAEGVLEVLESRCKGGRKRVRVEGRRLSGWDHGVCWSWYFILSWMMSLLLTACYLRVLSLP